MAERTLGGQPVRPTLPDVMPRELRSEPRAQLTALHDALSSFGQPSLDALRRGYAGEATAPEVARTFLETGPVGPFGVVRTPPRVPNPIRAYHGSPHDFDEFRMDRIGTGEGAQAYGHGMYFAEREGVARSYRDTLAANAAVDVNNPGQTTAILLLRRNGNDRTRALADAQDGVRQFSGGMFRRGDEGSAQAYREAQDLLRSGWEPPPGRMYEVNLHARPEQFLDWDRPLSGQNEVVREFIQRRYPRLEESIRSGIADSHAHVIVGETGERARALSEAGIPGIRYLDQGSRNTGQGTSNYVVFNPEIIEILRKYGIIAPPVGAAAAAGLGEPTAP